MVLINAYRYNKSWFNEEKLINIIKDEENNWVSNEIKLSRFHWVIFCLKKLKGHNPKQLQENVKEKLNYYFSQKFKLMKNVLSFF